LKVFRLCEGCIRAWFKKGNVVLVLGVSHKLFFDVGEILYDGRIKPFAASKFLFLRVVFIERGGNGIARHNLSRAVNAHGGAES
jgi:hypothetical protein